MKFVHANKVPMSRMMNWAKIIFLMVTNYTTKKPAMEIAGFWIYEKRKNFSVLTLPLRPTPCKESPDS